MVVVLGQWVLYVVIYQVNTIEAICKDEGILYAVACNVYCY